MTDTLVIYSSPEPDPRTRDTITLSLTENGGTLHLPGWDLEHEHYSSRHDAIARGLELLHDLRERVEEEVSLEELSDERARQRDEYDQFIAAASAAGEPGSVEILREHGLDAYLELCAREALMRDSLMDIDDSIVRLEMLADDENHQDSLEQHRTYQPVDITHDEVGNPLARCALSPALSGSSQTFLVEDEDDLEIQE